MAAAGLEIALSSTSRILVALLATVTAFAVASVAVAAPSKKAGTAATAKKKPAAKHARRGTVASRRAQPPAPVVIPMVDAKAIASDATGVARDFDRWLDGIEMSGDVAGLAVAIIKDDKVLLERGIGVTDTTTGEPITGDTAFRVASLSKGFAATLSGLLVEHNLLHWDTRAADLLPEFTLNDVDGARRLTLRDILSHRVGLPHNTYDNLLEQDEPYPLLVNRLAEVPLTCPVGDCYGYQNIAFSLVGDMTYAATGDFYYHQVEKRIFHPLGMRTATYGRDALQGSKSWARPHRRSGNGWAPLQPKENYYHVAPAAGVNASIRDMEQWLIAQMGGRPDVLSPQLLKTLHAPLVETERDRRSSPWRRGRVLDAQYALGWRVYDYAGTQLVFHAGAVQGYRAVIAFLPEYRFGTVMLWNCESAVPMGLMPMLLDRYLGLPDVNWAGIDHGDGIDLTGGSH